VDFGGGDLSKSLEDVGTRLANDLEVADHAVLYQLIIQKRRLIHAAGVALDSTDRVQHVVEVVVQS
jgi:hypothetical protein